MPSGTTVILYNKLHRYPHLLPYRGSQMTKSITGPMHSASQFLYSHNPSHQCDKCLCQKMDILDLSCHLINVGLPATWRQQLLSDSEQLASFSYGYVAPPKNAFCFDLITCNIFSPTQLTIHLIYSLFFFVCFFCYFLCQWLHYLIPCGVLCCNNERLTLLS